MKKGLGILLVVMLCASPLWAQERVTLEQCLAACRANMPQMKQAELLEKMGQRLKRALWHAYLPQIALNGKVTYQSHVPQMDLNLPQVPGMPPMEVDVPEIPKWQYDAYLQATQVIWDGGRTAAGSSKVGAEIAVQQVESKIRNRQAIDATVELYFGILMLEAQTRLQENYRGEVERQLKKVKDALQNGVASENDLDEVMLKHLEAEQQHGVLVSSRAALLESLRLFTGLELPEDISLVTPAEPVAGEEDEHFELRPEYQLMNAQVAQAEADWQMFKADLMPTLALFARGGYGKPGLNLFDPEPSTYGIYGVTLQWNFGKLYDLSAQRQQRMDREELAALQRRSLEIQWQAQEAKMRGEVARYEQMLTKDQELIELRKRMVQRAETQLQEGTITLPTLLEKRSALSATEQQATVHQLQYLKALYMVENNRGRL